MNYLNQPRKVLTFDESIELSKHSCNECRHYTTIVNLQRCMLKNKTLPTWKEPACIYFVQVGVYEK